MIRLPASFKPTHQTAGLSGYPAIDIFGQPGDTITAGFAGTVRRISGHPCVLGGPPGGAYGQSLYIRSANGDDRYLTHLDKLLVRLGDNIRIGTPLATLCNAANAGKPGTTHVHYGLHKAAHPAPPPQPRLYDVRGPKGRRWVKAKPMTEVAKQLPALVKKWGAMTVTHADSRSGA